MAGLIEKLHKIGDVINTVARVALGVTSIALCIAVIGQFILRWFGATMPWATEFSCYIFVWTTMLGSAVASRHLLHIGVDMVINLCHGNTSVYAGSGGCDFIICTCFIYNFRLELYSCTDSTSGNDDQGFAGALLCSPSGQRSHYDLLYICAAS